jgi:hypothetical protein
MKEKQFIEKWVNVINYELGKGFPNEFLHKVETEEIELPEVNLRLGSELFGTFELIDKDGNPVIQLDSYEKAKYLLYSNRLLPSKVKIPKENELISEAIKDYERTIDKIIIKIKNDFNRENFALEQFNEVTNKIFKKLNLARY